MEISLKNFRCWKDKTIQLSPEGITLLSGPSGVGKSSILEAVLFAITGKGRNIITQGKSSCVVRVVMNDGVTIIRKKRPNTLVVKIPGGTTYDDDAAQGYLNEKFTENFETLGYLGQNGKNTSFVLKGPADKLAFIEQLAFQNVDIVELKNKAYELFKEEENNFKSATAKVEVLDQQIEDFEELEVSKFPIKTRNEKEAELKIRKNLEKGALDLGKVEKKLASCHTLQKKIEIIAGKIDVLQPRVDELIEKELDLQGTISDIPEGVKEQFQQVKKKLKTVRRQRALKELEKNIKINSEELTRLQEMEMQEYRDTLEGIDLWPDRNKKETILHIKSLKQTVSELRESIKLHSKLSKINHDPDIVSDLESKQSDIQQKLDASKDKYRKAKLAEEVLVCPECNSKLKLKNDELVKSAHSCTADLNKNDCLKDVKKLTKNLKTIQSELESARMVQNDWERLNTEIKSLPKPSETKLSTLEKEIESCREYLSSNKEKQSTYEKITDKIQNKIFSKTARELENSLNKDKKRQKTLSEGLETIEETESELMENREVLQKHVFALETAERDLGECQESLEESSRKLSELEKKLPSKTLEEIRDTIDKTEAQKTKITTKIKKYETMIQQIQMFKIAKIEHQRRRKVREDLDEYQKMEKIGRKKTTGVSILRTKIKEAESICLHTFVQSIQNEVQMYLDEFFTKDPLVLRINTMKKAKSKKTSKPEINIMIDFKGRECDHTSLSGGELQRLVLAFTLAFTERFNLPFLLLDECTSNLDAELTSEVVSVMKKYQHSRPVLLVAHQVVSGMFDKVVHIE